jgi:hypothetical protein
MDILPENQTFTRGGRRVIAISPDGSKIVLRREPADLSPQVERVDGRADPGHPHESR